MPYTWNMFAFVVHCILYIITALCTLCGMSMFLFCFIYSRVHSKFSMEVTVLCVYGCERKIVYEHGILHALVFVQYQFHLTSVIALEIVVIIIYDVIFLSLLLLLPFLLASTDTNILGLQKSTFRCTCSIRIDQKKPHQKDRWIGQDYLKMADIK